MSRVSPRAGIEALLTELKKHHAPTTDRRPPTADRRMPNAERRTPNAER
jgi:hypothetical protein